MGAVGNVLADNVIRRAFSTRAVERALRPVIGMEEFGAGIVPEPPTASRRHASRQKGSDGTGQS